MLSVTLSTLKNPFGYSGPGWGTAGAGGKLSSRRQRQHNKKHISRHSVLNWQVRHSEAKLDLQVRAHPTKRLQFKSHNSPRCGKLSLTTQKHPSKPKSTQKSAEFCAQVKTQAHSASDEHRWIVSIEYIYVLACARKLSFTFCVRVRMPCIVLIFLKCVI